MRGSVLAVAKSMGVLGRDFSQVSMTEDRRLVGSPNETRLYAQLARQPELKNQPVDLLATMITPENPAVLVRDFKTDQTCIIIRSDLIRVQS